MEKEPLGIAPEPRHSVYPAIAPENFIGKLEGKTAFITGAGRGIGKAIALAFAQAGAHVALLARTESQLSAVAEEIRSKCNRRTLVLPVDVSETGALAAAFQKTEAELGKVDVVIANAGIIVFRPFIYSDFDEDCWRIMEVNFKAPLFVMQLAIRSMKERGAGGAIIAISSSASVVRILSTGTYSASKAALNTAVGVIQLELDAEKESGIHMYSVNPGLVETEILSGYDAHAEDMEKMKRGSVKWWSEFLQKDVVPAELCAQTCVYLAAGKAKELRGRYIDSVKDIESVVAQAEIVKRENLYDMGVKELGA